MLHRAVTAQRTGIGRWRWQCEQWTRSLGTLASPSAINVAAIGARVLTTPSPQLKAKMTLDLCDSLGIVRPQRESHQGGTCGNDKLPWHSTSTNATCDSFDVSRLCVRAVPYPSMDSCSTEPLAHPARPIGAPPLVPARRMKRPRNVPLVVYLLHSIAHIELNAIGALVW